jgi:hypothetical protein
MEQITGRVDQPDCFFVCQDDRQLARRSRVEYFFTWVVPLQCLAKEG